MKAYALFGLIRHAEMNPALEMVLSILILLICIGSAVGIRRAIRSGDIFISMNPGYRRSTHTYRAATPLAFWFCISVVTLATAVGLIIAVGAFSEGLGKWRATQPNKIVETKANG
jgi:ABC-type Fe3+ transport system permease subunit